MRIVPILIAVIVSAVLYAVVFERDRLESAVGLDAQSSEEPAVAETISTANAAPERQGAVSVVAMASRSQKIDSAVVLRGRTEPARIVNVAVEVSGRMISAPLRRGVSVSAGDVLCQLDPGTAEVTLAEARARLAEAEITANAASELAEEGFVSATRRASTAASLEGARAAVRRAERAIEDLTVTAPFGGVLEDDSAELGAYLSPQGGNGGQCATILQLDPIKIVGFVPETLVSQVEIGAPARARLSDGQEAQGTVQFIARQADETTRTFRVEVEVANPDLRLRAGQTAEVAVAAAGKSAHLLPASALTLDDDGRLGVRHVVDGDDGAVTGFAPVTIVRDSIDGVWLAGLPDEIDVIVVGQDFVTAGTPLTVTMREPGT